MKKINAKISKEIIKNKKKLLITLGILIGAILIIGVFFLGRLSNQEDEEYVYNPETDDRYWNPEEGTFVKSKTTDSTDRKKSGKGKIYNKVSLNDTQAGIVAFEGLLPDGWMANIESNWNVVSSTCPGFEEVTIESPDGKATIVMDSQQAYVENAQYAEGVNYDYYTTYLHYMDADTFVQYYIDQTYGENATLIKDFEDDSDILEQANECTQILVDYDTQSSSWINSGNYGVQYSVTAVPATMSRRQYQIGEQCLEASCVIMASDTSLSSKYVATNNSRNWNVTYSIVFMADDKETFDKYYDDYNFIVANSQFTTDYYAMAEYVGSAITNSYASYYAAKSQAGLEAMNNYIDSNYSSTTSESTNEKVMQMWDDVINEVDSYQTLEGDTIKTSMYNDTVAQDGDSFYVGSRTEIPSGYTELSKSY